MCLPVCVSWDLDLSPVINGDRLVIPRLSTGGRHGLWSITAGKELASPYDPVAGELVLEHNSLVEVELISLPALARNKPDLPSASAVVIQPLRFVAAGHIRALLLA